MVSSISGLNISCERAALLCQIDENDWKYLNPNNDKYIDYAEFKKFAQMRGASKYLSLFNYFDGKSEGALKKELENPTLNLVNAQNPSKIQAAEKNNMNSKMNDHNPQNKQFEENKTQTMTNPMDAEQGTAQNRAQKLDLFM